MSKMPINGWWQNQANMSTKGLVTTTISSGGLGTGMGITGLSVTGGSAGSFTATVPTTAYQNNVSTNTMGINGTQFTGQIKAKTVVLEGEDADIIINGKSLYNWLTHIERRLGMLTPNPEVEGEWEELKQLSERYRELEKTCIEKTKMWKGLKKI